MLSSPHLDLDLLLPAHVAEDPLGGIVEPAVPEVHVSDDLAFGRRRQRRRKVAHVNVAPGEVVVAEVEHLQPGRQLAGLHQRLRVQLAAAQAQAPDALPLVPAQVARQLAHALSSEATALKVQIWHPGIMNKKTTVWKFEIRSSVIMVENRSPTIHER